MNPIVQTKALSRDYISFAEKLLIIQDKAQRFVPLRYNRAQLDYLSKRTRRDLIVKARQEGFSTAIQAVFFQDYTTSPHSVLTMADKQENTDKLRRMAELFYQQLPPRIPKPIRSEANAVVTSYPKIGSKVAIATAGALTSGRAGTVTRFHGSEVAYWKNARWIIEGALQAVPEHLLDTWVVFESTANGANGWFYEECMAALRGDSEWALHFYAWWWADEYQLPLYAGETLIPTDEETMLIAQHGLTLEQIKWRRSKAKDLKERFQQEYPESIEQAFLTSGGGVFTLNPHNLSSYTVIAYQEGYFYVAGLDWGQDNDYTALSIMRVKTGENVQEVYLNRWRRQSWASIRAEIIEKLKEYHVEKLLPERNSIGSVNIEDLVDELDKAKMQTAIQAFYTDQRSKDGLVKAMQNGLSEYGLCLLNIDYATNELRTYLTKQSANGLYSYEAPSGGHDDTNMARMLAYYGASQLWI